MSLNEGKLQRIVDESDIRALVYKYCRAIDRRQWEDVRDCYHPGGTDHHGDFYGTADEFIEFVKVRLPQFERSMHFVGNLSIEIQGDAARVESYTLALARITATTDAPERDNLVALRYVDDTRRIDGEWRIMHRKCVYEWTRTDPVPPGWTFGEYHTLGRSDRGDIVYRDSLNDTPEVPSSPEIRPL